MLSCLRAAEFCLCIFHFEQCCCSAFPCVNRLWYFWFHPQPGVSEHKSGDDDTQRLHVCSSPQRRYQCNRIQQGEISVRVADIWGNCSCSASTRGWSVPDEEPFVWEGCSDEEELTYRDVALFNALFSASSQGFSYSVAFNSTTVHSLPMMVNILSNALLRGLNGTGQIRTWTKPFDYVSVCKFRKRWPRPSCLCVPIL